MAVALEWSSGIDLLYESDLTDCLKAVDEDLGDDDEMNEANLQEWGDVDLLLPGCTPERNRHRASPANMGNPAGNDARLTPPFDIVTPLGKKKRGDEHRGQSSRNGESSSMAKKPSTPKGSRATSPFVSQPYSAPSPPPLFSSFSPPPFSGSRVSSPAMSTFIRPSSRPASRLGARPPTPTKLTMRVDSEGTAIRAAVAASSVKRSASPFGKQGQGIVISGASVEALKNINKMVNRSAAAARAKHRSASRGAGSRSGTPTPAASATRPETPGLPTGGTGCAGGALAAVADEVVADAKGAGLVSFTSAPEQASPQQAKPKPQVQRFRQFGALGDGGTLKPCALPSAPPPAEKPAGSTCFTMGSSPTGPTLEVNTSSSGGDAAAAADGGGATGGARINFKMSAGSLRPSTSPPPASRRAPTTRAASKPDVVKPVAGHSQPGGLPRFGGFTITTASRPKSAPPS